MRLLKDDEPIADTVDLDAFGEDWRAALKPGIRARGRVLETDQGIRAAMAAGVREALVHNRLPALLACLHPAPAEGEAKPPADTGQVAPAGGISELSLLRLVALKGRASTDILADSLALPRDVVAASYAPLCERGLCTMHGNGWVLTAAGRDRLTQLLASERARADPAAVVALYEDFCVVNAELKEILTAWQIKPDGNPNDHRHADYDALVIQRLAGFHNRIGPLIERLAPLSPRMAAYGTRLTRAAGRIAGGDHSYVARIIVDSYHTVWFELHEDLIALAGLRRNVEARAGRAT
jgi:pyruvate,orthophosphate dikinase